VPATAAGNQGQPAPTGVVAPGQAVHPASAASEAALLAREAPHLRPIVSLLAHLLGKLDRPRTGRGESTGGLLTQLAGEETPEAGTRPRASSPRARPERPLPTSSGPARGAETSHALEQHLTRPRGSGAELRASASPPRPELWGALLAARGIAEGTQGTDASLGAALKQLASALSARIDATRAAAVPATSPAQPATPPATIEPVLVRWVSELVQSAPAGDLTQLAKHLRAFIGAVRGQLSTGDPLHASLARLSAIIVEDAGARRALGAAWVQIEGARLAAGGAEALRGALEADPRGRLLLAMMEQPSPERQLMLGSLLDERLVETALDLARHEGGETSSRPVPVPDGAGWAFAHLIQQQGQGGQGGADAEAGSSEQGRVRLDVDFSRLGPVSADLVRLDGKLHVRLTVDHPVTRRLLAKRVAELEGELGDALVRVVATPSEHVSNVAEDPPGPGSGLLDLEA